MEPHFVVCIIFFFKDTIFAFKKKMCMYVYIYVYVHIQDQLNE